jgi:hypothetical protein
MGTAALMLLTSCQDFLETNSKSKMENDFVFANEQSAFNALLNAYTLVGTGGFLGDRVTMNMNACGSDYELRPDYGASGRAATISLYPGGISALATADGRDQWNAGYKAINAANEVIAGLMQINPEVVNATTPTGISQMYGEALALRALAHYELVRNFGDVPVMLEPVGPNTDFYVPATSRWEVLDLMLEDLEKVAPMMMWSSEIPQQTHRMSRGFVYGLIAKIALTRGGYALWPNGEGVNDWGTFKRDDANWRKYYEQANAALRKLVVSGKHKLTTVDPRADVNNGSFGNPFQYLFQLQTDQKLDNETLWEIPFVRGSGSNWGYAFARVHTGAASTNVSKSYGAVRFTPHYFYSFDSKDMRRDVTCCLTYTAGSGIEMLINIGGVGDGGPNAITLNKWDKMRAANPYNSGNSREGISYVYMRYADALLLLAETEAALNSGGGQAKEYLTQVRSRAFSAADQAEKVTDYVSALSGDALLEAIKMERAWELGGECIRKHDLVRWGDFNERIIGAQRNIRALADGIRDQGYYTFPNGQQISKYIYVKDFKQADITNGMTIGTTYGTPVGKEEDPLLFPGWRGVGDASKFSVAPVSNLGMKGVFKVLAAAEVAALKADGWQEKTFGDQFLGTFQDDNGKSYSQYVVSWWSGYRESDYQAGRSGRYLCPIPEETYKAAKGVLKNYYGFPNPPIE